MTGPGGASGRQRRSTLGLSSWPNSGQVTSPLDDHSEIGDHLKGDDNLSTATDCLPPENWSGRDESFPLDSGLHGPENPGGRIS